MIKLLKNLNKKEWLLVLISFSLIAMQVWLELKMPEFMSKITVLVQSKGSSINDILIQGGNMLMCALGSLISSIIVGYLISYVTASFSKKVRKNLFQKVEDLALNEVKKFSTSSLITRTTNDITHVETFLSMGLQVLVKAPITSFWAISKILNKSAEWSIITAIAVAIMLTVLGIIITTALPRFKIIQKLTDKLNNVTRENLTGIRVVRSFNAEKYQGNKFNDVNNNLTKTQMFTQKTFAIMSPMMYLIMYFLTLAIYFVGAYLIKNALMSNKLTLFGDMVVFSSYSMQIIMSFLMMAMVFMILPRVQVSLKRINEVMNSKLTIKDGKFNGITDETGTVEFKNVSFKYPDAEEYLLKNISFKVNKGETVAFIGGTGSGKSTLINLVLRFYDVTEGEVLVDSVNVKEYKGESLRKKIGYIPQKAVIFNGTIEDNVRYGDSPDFEFKKVEDAIRVAQAEEFVLKTDEKYQTHIAQGGTNISGGQKQRLAISRAIFRNPEIYIFDDSFSALDYKTDSKLRHELKEYTKGSTNLIVAQRIGTILNADKIIVLDNGRCIGMGTHKELMSNCNEYKEIALSQLSKEELENA